MCRCRADTAEIAPIVSGPRLDKRLRKFIAAAPPRASAADVTRDVGDLAWELGLTRPSYQRVRTLLAERHPRGQVSTPAPGALHYVLKALNAIEVIWEYPGPGLERWYREYKRGGL